MDVAEYRAAATTALGVLARYLERSVAGEGPAVARRPPASVAGGSRACPGSCATAGSTRRRSARGSSATSPTACGCTIPAELAHQVAAPDVGVGARRPRARRANQPMSIYEMGAAAAAVELRGASTGWSRRSAGTRRRRAACSPTAARSPTSPRCSPRARRRRPRRGRRACRATWRSSRRRRRTTRSRAPSGSSASARTRSCRSRSTRSSASGSTGSPTALARVRAAGRRPMALVAAACATSTGLHDDLRAIGAFCREHGIWFHVDARARRLGAAVASACAACSTASSSPTRSIWDAHKMLRDLGAVRRRARAPRARTCRAAFQQHASYLDFDNPEGVDVHRPAGRVHEGRARPQAVPQPRVPRRARAGGLRRGRSTPRRCGFWRDGRRAARVRRARTGRRATSSASGTARPAARRRRSAMRCSPAATST